MLMGWGISLFVESRRHRFLRVPTVNPSSASTSNPGDVIINTYSNSNSIADKAWDWKRILTHFAVRGTVLVGMNWVVVPPPILYLMKGMFFDFLSVNFNIIPLSHHPLLLLLLLFLLNQYLRDFLGNLGVDLI